MSDKLILETSY